jgi:hypothetical protein
MPDQVRHDGKLPRDSDPPQEGAGAKSRGSGTRRAPIEGKVRRLAEMRRPTKGNGGGVSTSPHLPGSNPTAGEGNLLLSQADQDPVLRSCDPKSGSLSGFQPGIAASPVPSESPNEISLPRRSLFRFPFARRLRFRWTVRKVGAALACASASRFFLARPAGFFGPVDPCGCPRLLVSGSSFELSSVSGRPFWLQPQAAPLARVAQRESACG